MVVTPGKKGGMGKLYRQDMSACLHTNVVDKGFWDVGSKYGPAPLLYSAEIWMEYPLG